MRTRPRVLTGVALSLVLLGSACGVSDDADGSPATPTSDSPSAPESPDSTPADPAVPEESADAPDEGYLPTPDGVSLTDPGTRLRLTESAVAAWTPRQGLTGVVDVEVTRIEETTVQASLAGFDLDDEAQRSTPYFVRAKVSNIGETDLGARRLPLYFLDNGGMLISPTGVAQDFAACPGSVLPEGFTPGESTRSCLIFLVPEGATLQSIMFRPPEGVAALQWIGTVSSIDPPSKKQGDGQGAAEQDEKRDKVG